MSYVCVAAPVGATRVVELHGEIDMDLVEPLRACVLAGLEAGADVVVDLSAATLIECSALGVLVEASVLAERRRHHVGLAAPPALIQRTLAAVGLGGMFPTFVSPAAALREFAQV